MVPGEVSELSRRGEGEQKVRFRYLPLELAFEPLLAFVMLAMRKGYPLSSTAVPSRNRAR